MIYGGPVIERIQFNENSLWTGGANPSGEYYSGDFGAYQNFGELVLEPKDWNTEVTWPSKNLHNEPWFGEVLANTVDRNPNTKWAFVHNNQPVIWAIEYSEPVEFTSYSISSANDQPTRDPKNWVFEGSMDGVEWTQLDERNLDTSSTPVWPFPSRKTAVHFEPASSGLFTHYRFIFVPNPAMPHFQVAGIHLNPTAPELERFLDIENALCSTAWTKGGVAFLRESFASYPHQILATQISADTPGSITTRVRLTGAHGEIVTANGQELFLEGTLAGNGLRYATKVYVVAKEGTLTVSGNTLLAENCDSLLILQAAATDYAMDASTSPPFRSGTAPMVSVNATLNAAKAIDYETLKASHRADYRSLFDRATLDLGEEATAEPYTRNRLAAYRAGSQDSQLEALFFQLGRYLLIASSRDSLPANLQGLWNNTNNPPWFSDYHVNINLQMNYWMAEPANLAECHRPLLDFLGAIAPLSRESTQAYFGEETPGWTLRTSVNPFGGQGWRMDTPSSGWLVRHFWEHYAYSGDETFLLETAWPVMKETCEFWISRLVEDKDGKLVAPDAWSPEHGPIEDGVSYAQEVVWDLFTITMQAAEILGNESEFSAQLVDFRSRLLIPAIGPHGQVTEWANPQTEVTYGSGMTSHRHTSHLYGAFPGFQFDPSTNPAYAEAAKISLWDRGSAFDSQRSWTWPWRTALWARLGEPEEAYRNVRGLLTHNTLPNLLTTHPPFQIDGNLGFPAAVCEMLVQSHGDELAVLPSLPAAWDQGSFSGLRARGGVEVSASWQAGELVALTLRSSRDGNWRLKLPTSQPTLPAFVQSRGAVEPVTVRDGLLPLALLTDECYTINTRVTDTDDKDFDGFSDYHEWLAGTDPYKPGSFPGLTIQTQPEGLSLSWAERPGRQYRLEFSTDLKKWHELLLREAASKATFVHPVSADAPDTRFYRIEIQGYS